MRTTIYYFSGTGNSLSVARKLAERIGNCELVPIAKTLEQTNIVAETEMVGLLFPVYYWGMPKIVEDFVEKLDLNKSEYIFSVITLGVASGRTMYDLEMKLRDKGSTLNAGFKVVLPDNYIPFLKLPSEEKRKKKFTEAGYKLDKIAKIIKAKQQQIEKDSIFLRGIANIMHERWLKRLSSIDQKFYVNDKCNSCGICEKVCPVNNIEFIEGKPQWQHNCQECLACLHFCPKAAIQVNKKTEKQGRYHHPDVTVRDIMMQKE